MTHIHHIIPKHAGGTDDTSNLIRLTIEEHAEAHRLLWEKHGRWQDRVAWKMLSGQIEVGMDILYEESRKRMTGRVVSEETKDKLRKIALGRKQTKEHTEKIKKALSGKSRSQETKQKMHNAFLGRTSWNKGKKGLYTQEQRDKMRDTWFKPNTTRWNSGKSLSDEHKIKLSEAKKGRKASEESKRRMSESKKGKVRQYRDDGTYYMVTPSETTNAN